MKKIGWNVAINLFPFIIYTFLLINDYFPGTVLPDFHLEKINFALFILLLFIGRTREAGLSDVAYAICFHFYILFLIAVFTLAGGESQSGLSLNNIFLWIVFAVSLYDVYKDWRRLKLSNS